MAFRKRNIALTRTDTNSSSDASSPSSPSSPSTSPSPSSPPPAKDPFPPLPGVRPSPIDGRPTTSTGTPSLDAILAGHAGLTLGTSLLVGESGTTDYAGALLRFYAAQGVLHGHVVHVVGMGEQWGRELPGLSERDLEGKRQRVDGMGMGMGEEKMKIAWRYEGLGKVGRERDAPGANKTLSQSQGEDEPGVFCHTFDLAKRLTHPVGTAINYIPIPQVSPTISPFGPIVQNIQHQLSSTPAHTIHRLVIASLLSPVLYPPHCSQPQHILQFLHALRALLRQYSTRLTCISTLPLSLYPRSTGLVRWLEILSDGVFELSPFPYNHAQALSTSAATTKEEERPQGMFAVHKLPVWNEKGGGDWGGGEMGLGEDLAFTFSRRRFVVSKFSLPPVEGDQDAQAEAVAGNMPKKADLEF